MMGGMFGTPGGDMSQLAGAMNTQMGKVKERSLRDNLMGSINTLEKVGHDLVGIESSITGIEPQVNPAEPETACPPMGIEQMGARINALCEALTLDSQRIRDRLS